MLLLSSSGSNAHGQLGNGSNDDAHVFQPCTFSGLNQGSLPPGTSRVVHVATGANHTLILLENDKGQRELWGCGDGGKGQLGTGYKRRRMSTFFERVQLPLAEAGLGHYTLKLVEATWETSYVVLCCPGHPDMVLSFGSDDYGDLGVGGVVKHSGKSFQVLALDHFTPSAVLEIDSIHTGQRHVVIQVRTSSYFALVGWGLSRHGQLGSSTSTPFVSTPQRVTDVLPNPFLSCGLGIHHTLFQPQSNSIAGLGSDRKGQLQVVQRCNTNHAHVQSVHCTWNGSYIVVEDQDNWQLLSSGSNSRNQLGWIPQKDDTVGVVSFPSHVDRKRSSVSVACGSEHVLVLVSYSDRLPELWGWGWNEHGNLGLGHTMDIPLPVKIDSPGASTICGVWAGPGTSWICTQTDANLGSGTNATVANG